MSASRSPVSDGRVVELHVPTQADWTQQHPDGLVGTRVSLAVSTAAARYADMEDKGQGAIVPSDAAQGDDAEGYDMGMAIDGASHHDSQGAVFGSEGSVNGANDVEGIWVNLPAGLSMKAAGQTRHKSSTFTADRGERAVYGAFLEPVRADRSPSYRKHVIGVLLEENCFVASGSPTEAQGACGSSISVALLEMALSVPPQPSGSFCAMWRRSSAGSRSEVELASFWQRTSLAVPPSRGREPATTSAQYKLQNVVSLRSTVGRITPHMQHGNHGPPNVTHRWSTAKHTGPSTEMNLAQQSFVKAQTGPHDFPSSKSTVPVSR